MAGEAILIVDDNPANLKLARVVLSAAGFEVRTAVDAEDALRALRVFRPRVVLMDLQLPGMDGFDLMIALTAYAMKGDEEKARAAGCDGYLAKPIDTRSLASTVAGYLAGAEGTATS
jgi:CheY-like chemotaxis protein